MSVVLMLGGLLLSVREEQPVPLYGPQEPAKIQVRPLHQKTLDQLIKQRKGRALVLNVWATWCVPCVEEFPELIRLDAVHRSKGLDVVTLSIDFDDEVDSKVLPFLRRMKATMPAYVNAFPQQETLINALDPHWSGAIPATFIFDSRGTLRKTLIGKQTYEDFEKAVRSLQQRGG